VAGESHLIKANKQRERERERERERKRYQGHNFYFNGISGDLISFH
jgi:hypothetical protein